MVCWGGIWGGTFIGGVELGCSHRGWKVAVHPGRCIHQGWGTGVQALWMAYWGASRGVHALGMKDWAASSGVHRECGIQVHSPGTPNQAAPHSASLPSSIPPPAGGFRGLTLSSAGVPLPCQEPPLDKDLLQVPQLLLLPECRRLPPLPHPPANVLLVAEPAGGLGNLQLQRPLPFQRVLGVGDMLRTAPRHPKPPIVLNTSTPPTALGIPTPPSISSGTPTPSTTLGSQHHPSCSGPHHYP